MWRRVLYLVCLLQLDSLACGARTAVDEAEGVGPKTRGACAPSDSAAVLVRPANVLVTPALDEEFIYVSAGPDADVSKDLVRVSKCGGTPLVLVRDVVALSLAVSGATLYWLEPRENGTRLRGVPKDGGPVVTIDDAAGLLPLGDTLAADGHSLYYARRLDEAWQFWRVDGDERLLLWSGLSAHSGIRISQDDTQLFIAASGPDAPLWRLPKTGGPAQAVPTGQGNLGYLSAAVPHEGRLFYWALQVGEAKGPFAYSVPFSGGTPELLLDGQPLDAVPLPLEGFFGVANQTFYFISDPVAGVLSSSPSAGGPASAVFSLDHYLGRILLDDGRLYWTARDATGEGELFRGPG